MAYFWTCPDCRRVQCFDDLEDVECYSVRHQADVAWFAAQEVETDGSTKV